MAAYYNEFDEYAAQWLRNLIDAGHLPPGDVDSRSILDIQPEDLNGYDQCHFFAGIGIWGYALRRVGWSDSRGIWTGSCPCQPFSAAGRGLGTADERHLWPAWFWLIAQRRPAIVVGEQVASKDGLAWLDIVSTDLENAGYAVGAADLCAAGFSEQGRDGGGFHLRQRQYFIAICEGMDDAASARHAGALSYAERNSRDETRLRVPSERIDAHGLADPSGERRRETGDGDRRDEQAERGCRGGAGDRLADADEQGIGGRGISGREQGPSAGFGAARERPTGLCADIDSRRGDSARELDGVSYSLARGPNANLVYSRDGRWRPIEPESLPLAHAIPRSMGTMRPELLGVCNAAGFGAGDLKAARQYRAGALKGFGNALDAETVVGFLEAALPLAP